MSLSQRNNLKFEICSTSYRVVLVGVMPLMPCKLKTVSSTGEIIVVQLVSKTDFDLDFCNLIYWYFKIKSLHLSCFLWNTYY